MTRIAIVGVGKIARDQHVPAIAASPDWDLVATASPAGSVPGIRAYPTIEAMLAGPERPEAVALCQPPQARYAAARAAIAAGCHVLLEKPPGATLGEVEALAAQAGDAGVTLLASWHSRHAAGVAPARAWLAGRRIVSVAIDWREDVRRWHPGQTWIWEPGGLGVFDPGINALSIATHVLRRGFFLESADLYFPSNRAAPIAADLVFMAEDGAAVTAGFDFRQQGPQTWDIRVETDAGSLLLSDGGGTLAIDGARQNLSPEAEYPDLYAHFAALIRARRCDVDLAPLRHVADAFLRGRRIETDAFED